MSTTLLRPPVAFKRLGLSKSVAYERISKGLLPRPIKLGDARASALPDYEVEAVAKAYVAGQSDAQIAALVARLHAARQEAA
jgi:prophage regulatory protein